MARQPDLLLCWHTGKTQLPVWIGERPGDTCRRMLSLRGGIQPRQPLPCGHVRVQDYRVPLKALTYFVQLLRREARLRRGLPQRADHDQWREQHHDRSDMLRHERRRGGFERRQYHRTEPAQQ